MTNEPIAWMVYTLDGTSVCVTDNPADFTPAHRALPLYTTPPQQQAEPPEWLLIKNILDEYGLQAISFVAEWKAAQQQAEPVSHAVIVGALFDFMGWLTTRKERLILSSTDNASPAADAIKVFAEMRGLSLDDALVQDWQNYTTPPQQQAEPVAWDVFELRLFGAPQEKQHRVLWVERYIYPDGSTPDLDGLLDAAKEEGGIDGGAKTLHVRPLYTSPPQQQWDKPSASFNGWWDSYHHDPVNPFAEGSAAYWAWAGWKAGRRQWQGLTDEDYLNALDLHPHEGTDREFWNVLEAKLKEINNDPGY